jgi:cbb3-type cytochrome oxidase maturation protein
MSIIYVLIPIAMLFTLIAISLFIWATRKGQFEDLERHGRAILFDEPLPPNRQKAQNSPTPSAPQPPDAP